MTAKDRKLRQQFFLETLASFLAKNAAGKSMLLQVQAGAKDQPGLFPLLAFEWSDVYKASGLKGWVTEQEAYDHLRELFELKS